MARVCLAWQAPSAFPNMGLGRTMALWGAVAALAAPAAFAQSVTGEDLYRGRAPLPAHLRGHASGLPPAAVACVNCHEPGPQVASTSAAFAPRLDATLRTALPRRGGPPTAYDEAAFCRLLRTGLDPAHIVVRQAMPQFTLDDAQCALLWNFVSQRPLAAEVPQ
jgi:hypothetical protein